MMLSVHSTTVFQVATVLDQLHKFLGPELKAVTGESAGIDEIMDRVEGLALPLNKVIFDYKQNDEWLLGEIKREIEAGHCYRRELRPDRVEN